MSDVIDLDTTPGPADFLEPIEGGIFRSERSAHMIVKGHQDHNFIGAEILGLLDSRMSNQCFGSPLPFPILHRLVPANILHSLDSPDEAYRLRGCSRK